LNRTIVPAGSIPALSSEARSACETQAIALTLAFTVLVRNHMRTDEEIAPFCAEHGVTDSDLLIAQILVPFKTRRGETAKDAYERELRAMARNDDHRRKSLEPLPDTA
jgi:hypothetical protein